MYINWDKANLLVGVVKQCLENIPEEMSVAEQLERIMLEELKGDAEERLLYGHLSTVDAVR